MKKKLILASSITLGIAIVALTVVFLQPPVDTILSPYTTEPILPHTKNVDFDKTFSSPLIPDTYMVVKDSIILPDQSVISVGQVFTNRDIYIPYLIKSNLSGGLAWTTGLNPIDDDGITYSAYGTDANQITKILYVNDDLIYAIGSIQASIISQEGQDYPLKGDFTGMNIPIGLDKLNYILAFSSDLSFFNFLGFITPPEEEGTQYTIIADATLLDDHTMVLTGVTNSHEGLFAGVSNKDPFDFVLKLNLVVDMELVDIFTFQIDTYASPTKVYALQDGDLIVMGNYQDRSGDFADIPLPDTVDNAGFVARLDGETFTLEWVSSDLVKPVKAVAITLFINAMELTNHHIVTVANVSLANENYDRRILISVFDTKGGIVRQRIIDINIRVEAIRLFKATQGYWLIGTTYIGDNSNVMLTKLNANFDIEYTETIIGSNYDTLLTTPMINDDHHLVFLVNTFSKDEDYASLASASNDSNMIFIQFVPTNLN
jgi:hypothetical protein